MKPEALLNFYKDLENLAFLNIWKIQKTMPFIERLNDEDEQKLIVERKVLNFNINDGELISNVNTTNISGDEIKFEFSDTDIDYLKKRVKETKNNFLLARYYHVLWTKTKHNGCAKEAIENYIRIVDRVKENEKRQLPILLSALLYISKITKYKIYDIKLLSLKLVDELDYWLKPELLKSILYSNLFKSIELKDIAKSIPKWLENKNPTSYFFVKETAYFGLELYQKIGLKKDDLYIILAKNEKIILDQHPQDSDFVKYQTVGQIAKYYKLAGKIEESELMYREYNRLKQKVSLNKITTSLDDKTNELFNDFLKKQCEIILQLSPDQILGFFALNEYILNDPEEILNESQKSIRNSLHSLFSTTVFDINSNFKQLNQIDVLHNEITKNYTISLALKLESLFSKVFVECILSGKLNYYKIYDYLSEFTWYGQRFERRMTRNDLDLQSTWLSMLAPAIHNFISQFEYSVLMNTNKVSNFILSIDSLTIKFEGALRDFILLSGGNTSKEVKGEIREQLLDELLENSKTKEYFGKKDIELFKYTFTSSGRNLRNNVAHSFLQYSDYSFQTAALIFLCFLRLGKYNFNID